jgi:hypothetical protein
LGDGLTVNVSPTTELEVVGNITASGALFANLPYDSDAVTDGVVVCDTEDGKFYLTGSYGGGGGGGGTTVVANPGTSGSGTISTITIGDESFSVEDDDWFISGVEGSEGAYLSSSRFISIGNLSSPPDINSTVTTGLAFGSAHTHNKPGVVFGKGLQVDNALETLVGTFNRKGISGSLFTIGNGVSVNKRRNVGLFRSKSIDFSPDGLIEEDYFSTSGGGQLSPTVTSNIAAVSHSITVTFNNYANSDLTQDASVFLSATPSEFTGIGQGAEGANEAGNVTVSGWTSLQQSIDAYLSASGGTSMELELASIKLGGDFDSLSGETLSELEVGNETFITALGGPSTTNSNIEKVADAPMTVWTGSLSTDIPGGYLANGDSITSMEGIANSPGYTLGNGVPNQVEYGPSPSQVSNNVGVGSIHLECEFGSGVDVLSSPSVNIARPTFEFTFIVPSIIAQQLQLPEGAGFFIGRENDRPGAFVGAEIGDDENLGGFSHSALLTHIGKPDLQKSVAGLRILLGYELDNDGPGIQDDYSFTSFDIKNADSTHGYDRIGGIKANLAGTAVSYNTTSDKRLKENIKLNKNGLELIQQVKVRDFNWKNAPDLSYTGFIAQELEKIVPTIVTKGGKDPNTNPWTVNQSGLIPYMVKAIQEQQKLIVNLQKQIDQLK